MVGTLPRTINFAVAGGTKVAKVEKIIKIFARQRI